MSADELGQWKVITMKVKGTGEEGGVPCSECGSTGDGSKLLLCDKCNAGWHLYCLPQPLANVPDGEWTCPACNFPDRVGDDVNSHDDDIICKHCDEKDCDDANLMLLCDGPDCENAWHNKCLPIPLLAIPDGDWLCPECGDHE